MLEIKLSHEPFYLCRENTWNVLLRPEKNLTHGLRSPKSLFRLSTILTTIVKKFTLSLKLSRYFFRFTVAQGLRLVLTPTKSQMPYLTYKILICRLTRFNSKITVLCLKSNGHMNVKKFTLWLKLSRYFFMFNVAQGLRLVLTPTKSQMPYLTYKILICRLTRFNSKITVLCLKSNGHMNLSTSVVRILETLF